MAEQKLKLVRALRTGFWDGHRRRAGVTFPVVATANEKWFETVGDAPEGTELPTQLQTANPPVARSFVDVMQELGKKNADEKAASTPAPQTLSEAAAVVAPAGEDDGAASLL